MTAIHLITLFAIRSIAVNICDQYEQKPRIKAAIRFGNYTVLRFADRKVYRFENFMFANNGFTYGQTEDISQMWNRVNNTRIGSFPVEEVTAFPVMYNKNGSITKRIVHIIHEKVRKRSKPSRVETSLHRMKTSTNCSVTKPSTIRT